MKKWVTIQEAIDATGLSKPTIYKYIREGTLEEIPDPHRLFGEKRIVAKSLERLVAERQHTVIRGTTPHEWATTLRVAPHVVYEAIETLHLQPRKVKRGKRHIYDLSEEQCERIRQYVEAERRAPLDYDATYDVALFQKMKRPDGETVRITWHDEKKEWGAYVHGSIWTPLHTTWEPCYPIHREVMRSNDFITFQFTFHHPTTWETLDWLYTNFGVENCNVAQEEETLKVDVKTGACQLRVEGNEAVLDTLEQSVQSGQFATEGTYWNSKGTKRQTTIKLDEQVIERVKRRAAHHGMTMNDWIERAILHALS